MNAIPKFSEQIGSTFPELSVGSDFIIQGTRVYFDLVKTVYGQTHSLCVVIEANEAKGSSFWNNTSDPQNDCEFDFDKLEVEQYNIVRVENFDNVLATAGQPFFLTSEQARVLNDYLNEHFEEEKINEFKELAEHGEYA